VNPVPLRARQQDRPGATAAAGVTAGAGPRGVPRARTAQSGPRG